MEKKVNAMAYRQLGIKQRPILFPPPGQMRNDLPGGLKKMQDTPRSSYQIANEFCPKVKISLTIEVKKTEFDAEACVLHLAGTNSEESEHVKLGAYHTLHLELNRNFTVEKDCWDAVVLERLDEAADPARGAEVAAVAMQTGLGHVCLISGHMTITRAKVEVHIPKKRVGASGHAKAVTRFNEQMYQAVLRHIDFNKIKCVLVGSPGFVNQA